MNSSVAPLAFGLWLLLVGLRRQARGLGLAGGLTCLMSLAMTIGLTALLTQTWSLINLGLALALIAAGGLVLIVSQLQGRPAAQEAGVE